jgi:hypothetical protein
MCSKFRDDEETERRHGYQRIVFLLSLALDKAQKPYYCQTRNPNIGAVFTTVLHGLAPASSARASAANHRESSAPAGAMT